MTNLTNGGDGTSVIKVNNIIFDSIDEASKYLNVDRISIRRIIDAEKTESNINNTKKQKEPKINEQNKIDYFDSAWKTFLKHKKQDLNCNNTISHLKDIERAFKHINETLKSKKINPKYFKIEDLTKKLVEELRSELIENKKFSNRTINKIMTQCGSLIKFLNDKYEKDYNNKFSIPHLPVNEKRPKQISDLDFEILINYLEKQKINTTEKIDVKSVAKTDLLWLADAYMFQRLITSRREDVLNVKWSDIKEDKIDGYFIQTINHKKTRLNKKTTQVFIDRTPIEKGKMMDFFLQIGFEKYKNTDDYIIFGEAYQDELFKEGKIKEKILSRKFMETKMSKGFSFWGKKCFNDENWDLTAKSIRKM